MTAGTEMLADGSALSPIGFGAWLRQLREGKGLLLRQAAASTDMDPSHLGKAERGSRPPSLEQALALARCFDIPEAEMQTRFAAMQLYRVCGGDPAWVHAVGGFAQEEAAPYLTTRAPKNRRSKK